MDIEELNKTQIILLTLLISFVTSIATGIVTISLMNQAPKIVTDTVHRVIEKTVERVIPGEQQATIIENTKTIVISDEDFIIKAIEQNSKSLVRIFTSSEAEDTKGEIISKDIFVGLGVVISREGKIMINSSDLIGTLEIPEYFITIGETKLRLINLKELPNSGITLLSVHLVESGEDETQPIFKPVTFGNSSILKLGQSIISIGGEKSNNVLTGIISNLKVGTLQTTTATSTDPTTEEKSVETVLKIETNLTSQLPMSLLIDLDGELIGVKSKSSFYTPINLIKKDLEKIDIVATETPSLEI